MSTSLQLGNLAFRRGDYLQAVSCYVRSFGETPEMARFTLANLDLARRRLRASEDAALPPRVLIASTQIGGQADRIGLLARIYGEQARLDVLGAGQPSVGFPLRFQPLEATGKGSALQALAAMSRQPVDLLHLVGADEGSLLLAIAARALWRCPVVVDVGSDPLPEGPAWTAVDAVTQADGTLTSVAPRIVLPDQGAALLDQIRAWRSEPPRPLPAAWITVVKQQPRGAGAAALRALAGLGAGGVDRAIATKPPSPGQAPSTPSGPPPVPAPSTMVATSPAVSQQPAKTSFATATEPARGSAARPTTAPSVLRAEVAPTLAPASAQTVNLCQVAIGRLPADRPFDEQTLAAPATLVALLAEEPASALTLGRQAAAGGHGLSPMHSRLAGTARTIVDIGHLDDHTLRWRLEAEAPDAPTPVCHFTFLQLGPDGRAPVALARVRCEGPGPHFIDVRLRHSMFPVLLVATDARDVWLDASLLPFPSLCRGGLHHAELWMTGTGPASMAEMEVTSNALVHELVGAPLFQGALVLESLEVDLTDANGAERLFQAPVREWLSGVMGLPTLKPAAAVDDLATLPKPALQHLRSICSAGDATTLPAGGRRLADSRTGGLTLRLPADAVPTLSLLASRRTVLPDRHVGAVGPYAIAEFSTFRPQTLVNLPPMDAALLALQPAGAALAWPILRHSSTTAPLPPSGPLARSELPLAIRLTDRTPDTPARALAPVPTDQPRIVFRSSASDTAPASGGVTVVLDVDGVRGSDFARLLKSLQAQTVAEAIDLVVSLPATTPAAQQQMVRGELQALWPGRHRLIASPDARPSARLNEAARHARDFLLFLETATFLHDARTVETLRQLAAQPGVGSASCVLVREVPAKKGTDIAFASGGLFPGQLSFTARVSMVLEEVVTRHAFPLATYPVIGNTFRLAMVPAAGWGVVGGLDALRFPTHHADVDFCLRAAAHGLRHVCTSVLTASSFSAPVTLAYADTHALRLLPLDRWHEMLAHGTTLRDLVA